MESLQIKCPACGIILEVTNSKNESVKRIVCPNCKKTLAITFCDNPKTEHNTEKAMLPALYYGQMRITLQEGQNQIPLPDADHFTIRVVRLKDGNCKCLVSTKFDNTLRLNDEYLLIDDEIALSDGDLLRFGQTVLSFNKLVETVADLPDTPKIVKPSTDPDPEKKSHLWVAVAACIAAMVLIAVLWPKEEKVVEKAIPEKSLKMKDSISRKASSGTTRIAVKRNDDKTKDPSIDDYIQRKDYELEKLALTGDVKAQYELGKRWVNSRDSVNIVKGSNYLKLASRNGSAEASRTLQKVKSTLREAANNGNTHADNLLKVINGEQ